MGKTTSFMPGWLRATLSFILIFLVGVMTPNAVISSWLKAQITDTSNFVEMTTTAIDNPAVESYISEEVSSIIIKSIDIDALASDLFNGLDEALPLGDKASAALSLLEKPLVNGAKSMITDVTEKVIKSDAFDNVTEKVLTVSHQQIMALLRGDNSGAIVADDKGVIGIQIGPIVDAVKEQLVSQGIGLADRIPKVNAVVEIGKVDGLVQARIALGALDAAGYWLPIIVIIMLIAGVLLARQRARATVWAGIAVVIGTGLALSGISVGRYAFLASVSPDILPGPAANVIFTALTERLQQLMIATLVIGLLVAITAYLAGPFRGAEVIRSAVTDTAGSVRSIAEDKGLTTGKFGEFVERAHAWIIGAILGVTALVLFMLRPFSVSGAVWAAIIALVLVLVVQLVRRPEVGSQTAAASKTGAGSKTAVADKSDKPKPSKKAKTKA